MQIIRIEDLKPVQGGPPSAKNGLSRSEQKTLSTTQNNRLTEKAPYKSANFRSPSGGAALCECCFAW